MARMGAVSHERRGSGSPVVLVHGLGSRWQCFAPILDRLAEHHEVIAVDLPGFGDSPADPGVRPGPRGYADWLAGWLAEEGVERPHVVGSSMGGGVALELGRRGVASGVTAFAPVGFYGAPGLRWVQGSITAIRTAARVGRPAFDRAVDHAAGRVALLGVFFGHPTRVAPDAARIDIAGLTGATSFTQARNDFSHYRLTPGDDLGALPGIPVTVAWGTRDVILIHRTQSARSRAALPFAHHVDLPGCGHLPFNDDPATCARLVLEGAAIAEEK
jgi:pimeloyl-ACP methyl ester carboxylesterase